jgi:hypothetical protein
MRSRSPRTPSSLRDAELVLQLPRVSNAVEQYAAALRSDSPEPLLWGFDEETIRLIVRQARRQASHPFHEASFVRAMEETRPLATYPKTTDPVHDLWLALAQPEIAEDLWSVIPDRRGSRGPDPGIAAKALMVVCAALGTSAHFNDNWHVLSSDRRLQSAFVSVEEQAAIANKTRPRRFGLQTYEQSLRQLHMLAEGLATDALLDTNIRIVKEVHALLRPQRVRLGIDGMLSRAWVKQVGAGSTDAEEAAIRGAARKAGVRYYAPRRQPGGGVSQPRFIRGHDLITLLDLTTGLPLTWVLWDANHDEAKALKLLLHDLYSRWPDLQADAVVADAAWDENWAAEWCLPNYGLHLVARRKPSRLDTEYGLSLAESKRIASFRGDGQAICRKHQVPLIRDGIDGLGRVGLSPGEPSGKTIRLRYQCPADPSCGRLGLAMRHSWPSLSYYPHRMEVGRPDLHAQRLALLTRRNACEALNSALQVGHSLGLDGADRMRTQKETTVEALFSLALLLRSAAVLADQRLQRGLFRIQPPPALAAVAA